MTGCAPGSSRRRCRRCRRRTPSPCGCGSTGPAERSNWWAPRRAPFADAVDRVDSRAAVHAADGGRVDQDVVAVAAVEAVGAPRAGQRVVVVAPVEEIVVAPAINRIAPGLTVKRVLA